MKKKTGRGKPAKSGGYQPKQDQKNGSIFIFELISWAISAVIVISVLTQIPSFDRWLEKTIYASEERAIKKKKEQERREQEHQKEEVQKQTEQESNILLLVNATLPHTKTALIFHLQIVFFQEDQLYVLILTWEVVLTINKFSSQMDHQIATAE